MGCVPHAATAVGDPEEPKKGRRSQGQKVGRAWSLPSGLVLASLCPLVLVLLCVLPAGCGGNKKGTLTEEEIREKTFAQRPTRPDEMVIGGETITCEDVMIAQPEEGTTGPTLKEELEERARMVDLDQFLAEAKPLVTLRLKRSVITQIVLAKRARREYGNKFDEMALDSMAEKELRRFILEECGGDGAAADAALQRRGLNRTTFKERRKRDIIAQSIVDSKLHNSRPVTYGEIQAKYEQIKDQEYLREGSLQLRLIDLEVARVARSDPNGDPRQKAGQIAQDLRKRIDAGEDFAGLAKQYSNDARSGQGGLLRPRAPDAFAAPYDVLARQAQDMKQGEVAGPIEVPGHVFLMKVEAKQNAGYQPLEEVQAQVRQEILRERRRAALEQLEKEIAQQAAAADTSQFVDHCLELLYRQTRAEMDEDAPAAGKE